MRISGWRMRLSRREYVAVVFDHDSGEWYVDLDFIPNLTGDGDIWNTVTEEWEWLDSLPREEADESMARVRALKNFIEGEDING